MSVKKQLTQLYARGIAALQRVPKLQPRLAALQRSSRVYAPGLALRLAIRLLRSRS
jgi:hypothetical protein